MPGVRADDFEARHHQHQFEPIAQFTLYYPTFVAVKYCEW